MNKKEKGITLVALIITIIIMLILASVAINLMIGDNGIFQKSEQSVGIHDKQEATEEVNLKITYSQMRVYAESQRMPTLQEVANDFCEDEEVQYVELESKRTASIDKVEIGEAKSFFTKLKKYPYEFEINSSLQLASIDGVKIAENTQDESILAKLEEMDKKLTQVQQELQIEKEKNTPTGIKSEAYVVNEIRTTVAFSTKTSMSGLTRGTDENNNIAEYLSFSEVEGYNVLKAGWYFVNLVTILGNSPSDSDLRMSFYINKKSITDAYSWGNQSTADGNCNAFPIYLKKDDKIYFSAASNSGTSINASAMIYPMF